MLKKEGKIRKFCMRNKDIFGYGCLLCSYGRGCLWEKGEGILQIADGKILLSCVYLHRIICIKDHLHAALQTSNFKSVFLSRIFDDKNCKYDQCDVFQS